MNNHFQDEYPKAELQNVSMPDVPEAHKNFSMSYEPESLLNFSMSEAPEANEGKIKCKCRAHHSKFLLVTNIDGVEGQETDRSTTIISVMWYYTQQFDDITSNPADYIELLNSHANTGTKHIYDYHLS